ncbi:hypothetical protein [Mycobacterium lepromatosis]|uniref:hypothetical protein n=2 Tax=Mycobacterium lepromatosis TaxID=480418 RepID=UPI00138DE72B|nr:hypothetical protein [Mycobacterium lepromatosis]
MSVLWGIDYDRARRPRQYDAVPMAHAITVHRLGRCHNIVAYLSAIASLNPATRPLGMAKAKFSFDKFTTGQIAKL